MNTSTINVQVDRNDKEKATKILDELGLSMTAAISIYIKKIINTYSIPFEVKNDFTNSYIVMEDETYNSGKNLAFINTQIDGEDKKIVTIMLKELGLNLSTAINMFLKQVINTNSIPFKIGIPEPSEELLESLKDGDLISKDTTRKGYNTMDDLIKSLEED